MILIKTEILIRISVFLVNCVFCYCEKNVDRKESYDKIKNVKNEKGSILVVMHKNDEVIKNETYETVVI